MQEHNGTRSAVEKRHADGRDGGIATPRFVAVVALMESIHRRGVVLPRSYSPMVSLGGFPALQSDTICLLNSSAKRLGCFGSAVRASFLRPS